MPDRNRTDAGVQTSGRASDADVRDELLMLECLLLARKGAGAVSPNPLVGAVIERHGTVIARGYHRRFGGPHAEPDALRKARTSAVGSTLYVNLEPCNHTGKTPPCTDAIIAAGVARVVVGMKDPNPLVAGKGIAALRRAGIRVDVGVLSDECKTLNEAFSTYITTGSPFVTLKVAQTLDGNIADHAHHSRWITSAPARNFVHRLRASNAAVLVGGGTVRHDDPLLTPHGLPGRVPLRIVVSGSLELPPEARIFSSQAAAPTLVVTTHSAFHTRTRLVRVLQAKGVEFLPMASRTGRISWKMLYKILGRRQIASVLVEGGSGIFASILRERAAEKIITMVAPGILGAGIRAFDGISRPVSRPIVLSQLDVRRLGPDVMITGYPKW